MMNCLSHSPSHLHYSSEEWHESVAFPGVRFAINRISLGSRLTLNERLRDLLTKYEFLKAGDALDNTEASLADLMVRRLYLEWGLISIEGLLINGIEASIRTLIDFGPESLSNEIIDAIRSCLELSEQERKNS